MMEATRTPPAIRVVHPTGNTFSRALVGALHRRGMLEAFHTCLALSESNRNPLAEKLFGPRRCPLPPDKLRTRPTRELLRLLAQRCGAPAWLRRHETGPLCVDRIYRGLDEAVARDLGRRPPPDAVYAYEDGARSTFLAACGQGVRRLYDLPIGYWRSARRIQADEAGRRPEWAATMPALRDSEAKLARKDDELRLAEHIFVASRFTAETLAEAPFALPKPTIVPYGCPPAADAPAPSAPAGARLRVLFVGSLSQRKGVADLIEAVERMPAAVKLTLVGRRVADCPPLDAALRRHRWIESLPHAAVLRLLREHDVLVFPSLFEGFGLVVTEALSQGVPVIATPHTCAPDVLTEGVDGHIVPVRDPEAIAERLERLHAERGRLDAMRAAALETARRLAWSRYEEGMADAIAACFAPAEAGPEKGEHTP